MDRHRRLDDPYSTLPSSARHVRGRRAGMVAFPGPGVGVAAFTLMFAVLAAAVQVGGTERFDVAVVEWFAYQRTPLLDEVMLEVTTLGNGLIVTTLAIVAGAFLWLAGHRWSVYLLLVAVIGGQMVNSMLKTLFGRPRPDMIEGLDPVRTLSFPSGHAMSAIIAWGGLALVLSRMESGPAMRRTTWGLAALVILGIGVSRIYLGVHYPSDVLAGYAGGLAWLAAAAAIERVLRARNDPSRHGFAPDRGAGSAHDRDTDARAAGQDAGRRRRH
ncbi:MAG TPA: phosphatase PAP2 family protein [Longimicrobiales bacterium]|nr:phosphatase PAP2 family protein [Longimicrobiales bacterium]